MSEQAGLSTDKCPHCGAKENFTVRSEDEAIRVFFCDGWVWEPYSSEPPTLDDFFCPTVEQKKMQKEIANLKHSLDSATKVMATWSDSLPLHSAYQRERLIAEYRSVLNGCDE